MQPRRSAYIDRHVERMIEAAHLTKTARILDVGCGIGKYTLNLADRGFQIEGLDIAEGLLKQAREHNSEIPFHAADIASPPPVLMKKFDAVIGFFALHHMFDFEKCLMGMRGLLKEGGRLVFIEPNPYNILYYFQIFCTPKMTWEADRGILKMRPSYLFPLMKKVGFTQQEVKRCGFFPPFISDLKGMIALEKRLEKFPLWNPFLPFQIFIAR